MPDETSQPSDTGKAAASGIQIPKERMDEAVAKERERAAAAERRFQESLAAEAKKREAAEARLAAVERRFAPEPEETYEDPTEKALKKLDAIEKKLADRDAVEATQATYRTAGNAITAAVEAEGIENKTKAYEALAKEYGAAQHFGSAWDPVAAAKAYREEEKAVAELRARAAKDNADATRSAITGSGSTPAVSTSPAPKRPHPSEEGYAGKVREWEATMEKRLIEEARAGG